MGFYTRTVRPVLFALPAESAHNLAKRALSFEFPWRIFGEQLKVFSPRLECEVAGLFQLSPFGLTAGFDKDALALPGLSHLGFGSVTVGAILPKYRAGNPKPRLARCPAEAALVNCMGLPSKGLDYAVNNLQRYHAVRPVDGPPIIANVGGFSIDEILATFRATEPYVDAVELDLTCPNVMMEGELSKLEGIRSAMEQVVVERTKPVFTKLPLRTSEKDWGKAIEMSIAAAEAGLDGITAAGNLRVQDQRLSKSEASLTGRPCFENTLKVVRELRGAIGRRLAVRVSGGVSTGEDVYRLLQAGADAANAYTSFVYHGPSIAARINQELLLKMDEEGVGSVNELKEWRF